MKSGLLMMTGIGFTLGLVFGLLLQLPSDSSHPADQLPPHAPPSFRSRRSLSEEGEKNLRHRPPNQQIRNTTFPASSSVLAQPMGKQRSNRLKPEWPAGGRANASTAAGDDRTRSNGTQLSGPAVTLGELAGENKQDSGPTGNGGQLSQGSRRENEVKFKIEKDPVLVDTVGDGDNPKRVVKREASVEVAGLANSSEDSFYLQKIVHGVTWSPELEKSCPAAFLSSDVAAWRRRVENLDVVKMEEGCGRMQNRLVTFRDATKACARYRLNTDQIQGEIFSFYLARLLNMTNTPPTTLAQVDTLSSKWRTVHLQLSLAQWADSKLVVLTQHIADLSPAHIPLEFREEKNKLEPTLAGLGMKSQPELCELVQWSDLIIFDYLTANLDRVINNMFNRQWNDQMMSNPAHNLEQLKDGTLVFLDNESGLFHGYRLLDKYASYHLALLHSLCVFRTQTVDAVTRLHKASSVGQELHSLFAASEPLHKHLAKIPEKNVKILQQRLDDVYQQIAWCQGQFGR
ncbi:four-jointed box protein 1-like [Physella acuta]|uniref:four-jointed box protein 1-like n=1 Tax=Physella acuta TaxID=109671 RepID=UPI0027DC88F3|nr:four-jointed box protein 1-like [Physella acuta]XP_059159213.1 four-jointed box protein 1-like [Physella acuta]XP_059159215.1 four-jointed box protein 1-like [Physella acuta]